MNKIYAIPDIHGEYQMLLKALEVIQEKGLDESSDKVIFLGDMIDRGPYSSSVVQKIKDLCTSKPECYIALYGNHEDFMINSEVRSRDQYLWQINGGAQTLTSYNDSHGKIPESHLKWVASLPRQYETDKFFFSHAPIFEESSRSILNKEQYYTQHELIWSRKPMVYYSSHPGPKNAGGIGPRHLIGIAGHCHEGENKAKIFPQYRILDAGCGCLKDGRLTVHECVSCTTWYITKDGGVIEG